MKSEPQSVLEQLPAQRAKRSINPWVLIFGTSIGGVVLIAVVLWFLAWMAPEPQLGENERRLPDGSILKIEGVTWGQNHAIVYDYSPSEPWRFWDHRKLPIIDFRNPPPVLRIWMSHRNGRSGRSLDFDWWGSSTVINSLGVEISDSNPQHRQIGRSGIKESAGRRPFRANHRDGDAWVVSSSFPAFRTDNGRFPLRVKNTSGEVVATFELTHPSPPPVKNWQAEELPATKSDGDLTVTLHRLQREFYSHPDGRKLKTWYFSPETTVTENGLPTNDWYFGMSLDNPFGNNFSMLGTTVSAGEPAWRVHLSGYRRENTEFPAAETWTLADVPLPPAP